ncbi:MAG: TraB/GumN family protein [Bacteroidota bacterium]
MRLIYFFTWIFYLIAGCPTVILPADNTPSQQQHLPEKTKKKRKWGIFIGIGALIYSIRKWFSFPMNLEEAYCKTHFYRIESEASPKVSYLYGITHIASSDFTIPNVVKAVIPKIDQLILEGDMNRDQDFIQARETMWNHLLALYQEDKQLFIKSKPFFYHLQDYQKKDRLRFVYGTQMITIAWEGKITYPAELLLDLCSDKEKGGLETFQEIKTLLNKNHDSATKVAEKKYEKIIAFEQSSQTIQNLQREYGHYSLCSRDKQLYNFLTTKSLDLASRNRKWSVKMIDIIEKKNTLFSVGISHLPTDFGLLYLLLKQGKRIVRISDDGSEEIVTLKNYNQPFL